MPNQELSNATMIDLVLQAGPVVKLVLAMLLATSIWTWAVIITKQRKLRLARRDNAEFLKIFWSSKNLDEVLTKSEKLTRSPVANVFKSGFKELKKLPVADRTPGGSLEVENIYRALNKASMEESLGLEKHVGGLATTASAAPFVGLFGTVWGIMNAFHNIGATGAANLAVVAPGISEALIATAVGLGAAIPSVIAYNHFGNQIRRITSDIDTFTQDFLNLIQRSFLGGKKA